MSFRAISKSPPPALMRPDFDLTKNDHKKYLKKQLESYQAFFNDLSARGTGVKGVKNVKGEKSEWIIANIIPGFVKEFDLDGDDGPNLASVKQKVVKWFNNNVQRASTPTIVVSSLPKAPRATNAASLFAADHADDIKALMSSNAGSNSGGGASLSLYRESKQKLFDQIGDEDLKAYEERAAQLNGKRKENPDAQHTFENQNAVLDHTSAALRPLIGHSWGGLGDICFFVMGAYRNEEDRLKIFSTSIMERVREGEFISTLDDYESSLRKPFKLWVSKVLPRNEKPSPTGTVTTAPPVLSVSLDKDGIPIFPSVDIDKLSPDEARALLHDYVEASWKYALPLAYGQVPVPWDQLRSPVDWSPFLLDSNLAGIKCLDPKRANVGDIYNLVELFASAQEHPALQFSIPQHLLEGWALPDEDSDIDEVGGGGSPRREKRSAKKVKKVNTAGLDFSPAHLVEQTKTAVVVPGSSGPHPPPTSQDLANDGTTSATSQTQFTGGALSVDLIKRALVATYTAHPSLAPEGVIIRHDGPNIPTPSKTPDLSTTVQPAVSTPIEAELAPAPAAPTSVPSTLKKAGSITKVTKVKPKVKPPRVDDAAPSKSKGKKRKQSEPDMGDTLGDPASKPGKRLRKAPANEDPAPKPRQSGRLHANDYTNTYIQVRK